MSAGVVVEATLNHVVTLAIFLCTHQTHQEGKAV